MGDQSLDDGGVEEWKEACESCLAPITWVETAYHCSYNCTFCTGCADELGYSCPNCSGVLRKRAARAKKVGR